MANAALTPAERLEACLKLLLGAAGTGAKARQNWTSLHDAYVASPPPDESAYAFFALERLAVRRVARWLAVLREEGYSPTATSSNGRDSC